MLVKTKGILEDAELFVFELFKEKLPPGMIYHNFEYVQETVLACKEMAAHYQLSEQETEKLLLAAWLQDTGYIKNYKEHEKTSVEIATGYLSKKGINEGYIREVASLISSTRNDHSPEGLSEEILHDADHIYIGKKSFCDRAELLREEWKSFLDVRYEDAAWHESQLKFLKGKQFCTQYAIEKFGERREKNISKQTKLLLKSRVRAGKFGRGIETMYRAVYRNHINLSSIADNKANMMISINTIIVSVIMAVISSGFTLTGSDFVQHIRFTVPMCILLVGSLTSVIFAILSASPNVTSKEVDQAKIKKRKTSVLFFGNFINMELQRFVESMQMLRKDQEVIYDNMSVDLHYLGHVLQRKYRLLTISYMAFLGALSLCVLAFLVILLYSYITLQTTA